MSDEKRVRVRAEALEVFCQQVLQGIDIAEEDARIAAEVLVTADLRGIDSHGVARLRAFYVDGVRNGMVIPRP